MSVTVKFFVFQAIISGGFVAGYFFQKITGHKTDHIIRKILKTNLIFFEPIIILNSIWGISITRDLVVLPFIGLMIVVSGFLLGKAVAPMIAADPIRKATFTISSSLSNQGFTMGAFVCYILIGPKGLALSFVLTIYYTFYLYLFIFNYASAVKFNHVIGIKMIARNIFQLQNISLYTIIISLILSACNIKRPVAVLNIDILIFFIVFLYFLSLGMEFRFRGLIEALMPSLYLAIVKFAVVPFLIIMLVLFFPVSHDAKTVLIIESFMPTGVFSVVTASLYELDRKFASSLFLLNTAMFMLIVLPLLLVFRKLIM